MAKIDSTTPSGAQLTDTDDAPMPERSTGAKVREGALTVVGAVVDGASTLVPFSGDTATALASDTYEFFANSSSDKDSFAKQLIADPKRAMASTDQRAADWYLRHFSPEQRDAALAAFVRAGMTKKVEGEPVPAGAPKPPALYEVNGKQAPATQQFLHGVNVRAARDYDDAYDKYASAAPDPKKITPYVDLEEPGSRASLEEGMSREIAHGAGDYALGKWDDIKSILSVTRQTRKLSVGDELQLQGGADGVFAGAALGASVAVKVKRGADGYHVSPQGSLSTGAKAGDGSGSGTVTWGGEYHCKTCEEVERVTTLIAMQAKGAALSKVDQDFLDERISGLDLKGSVAAKLATSLDEDKNVKLSAGLKGETSMHVDLEARTVTVSQKYSGDMSGQFASHQGLMPGEPKSKMTNSFDSGTGGDVTVTTKYSLPQGTSWESFKANPGATLNAIATQNLISDTSVKVHLQTGDRAVDVEAKGKDVRVRDVVGTLSNGGAAAAAQKLADESKVTVKVDRFKTTGMNVGPKLGSSVDSLSVSLKAQRTHHEVKQVATLKEALAQLTG